LEGILQFRQEFRHTLVTETMLVGTINDGPEEIQAVAEFLTQVGPSVAYLSVPIRPPTLASVRPPTEEALHAAYAIFQRHGLPVEYLVGYEGDDFSAAGPLEETLLRVTSVHPMKQSAVEDLVQRTGGDWSEVDALVASGRLVRLIFQNDAYYVRALPDLLKK
jgi:wyosine [tRNA(Phe)-imidazoG37] synthetase (radical SAM superfamily)